MIRRIFLSPCLHGLALIGLLLSIAEVTPLQPNGEQAQQKPSTSSAKPSASRDKVQQISSKAFTTMLQVEKGGGDLNEWVSLLSLDIPLNLNFKWTTKQTGASTARWQVTDKAGALGGETGHVFASGALPSIPSEGQLGYFGIDFKQFTPAKPPDPPYNIVYYVKVILLDAQNQEMTRSTTVKIVYQAPGATTELEEDLDISMPTHEEAVLTQAYNALRGLLKLREPIGDFGKGPGLAAFRLFKCQGGIASMELDSTAPTSSPRVWVAVPRLNAQNQVAAHQWFEFYYDRQFGWITPTERVQDPPPERFQPFLQNPGNWNHNEQYYSEMVLRGEDPPHWSPILTHDETPRIGDVHSDMQYAYTQSRGQSRFNPVRKTLEDQDLTDRAMLSWQSVKLCGVNESAGWPSGDLGADHTTDYNNGEEAPSGGWSEETDPASFSGMDWDMTVIPDEAYNYLCSPARPTLKVEIEHFAILNAPIFTPRWDEYFPLSGQWVQVVGRWVTDNGHPEPVDNPNLINGFYTEIHPPELMVATRAPETTWTTSDLGVEARVVVTGAWQGEQLTFVVNPPARPSPTARLKWDIYRTQGELGYAPGFDRKDKCNLTLEPRGTPGNPSYLLAKVNRTGSATIIRYNSGMVGMSGSRGMRCIIRCWWEDPTASVSGRLLAGNQPIRGAYMFYRPDEPNQGWQIVSVDDQGRYSLPRMQKQKGYWLRPASSGWNFKDVPRLVTLNQASTTLDFQATRIETQLSTATRTALQHAGRCILQLREPTGTPAPTPQEIALNTLRSMLIVMEDPSHSFGVWDNKLGYSEQGRVHLQLHRMLGWDDQPVPTQEAAFTLGGDGSSLQINGIAGPPVAGARIQARLLLGNPTVGYKLAQRAEAVTNNLGIVVFRFSAGEHFEDALIEYEVLENPVNPWFKPKFAGSALRFYPPASRGDVTLHARPTTGGRGATSSDKPYKLEAVD